MRKEHDMTDHIIAPYSDWFEAHKSHLAKEKALTRQRQQLAAERRALPWLRIDKLYEFDTTQGRKSLADLFEGRSQLIIYHFMFPPNADYRCTGCSFLCDHIDAANQHLRHHDVSLVVCARAPLAELMDFKARMNWQFDWASSFGSDFNFDFQVSFTEDQIKAGKVLFNFEEVVMKGRDRAGATVFYRDDDGTIYCTFQVRSRGGENLIGTYSYLDLTPIGRNENGPSHTLGDWVRLHDEYDGR
ncbi:thioredoxin [Mesorhizobium sp. WSM4312]|nr:thioredoxin [Mesorhizobium sp. WSM4312]